MSNRPFPRLDSDWAPAGAAGGVLKLTLSNVCDLPLGNFRLAFTSLFPLVTDGGFEGARLLDRVCGFHVIAPPEGLVLTPGASWSASIRLDWTLQHYTSALKSAYLILEDGSLLSVDARPTTRNHDKGAPRLRALLPSNLAETSAPLAVLPFPLSIRIAGLRRWSGRIGLIDGPREAQLAFGAATALADRLFPSEPSLFVRTDGIACTARQVEMAEEAYRIEVATGGIALLASGRAGFFYGLVTLGQMLRAARYAPAQFAFPLTGEIADAPRFAWRDMLLDVARQVYPAEDLLALLDYLAWHKLNRLHLHLSDNEGWRLDIPGYPQLAERAGWRGHGLPLPPLLGSPPERYGIVYTRAALAQVAQRADELLIKLVPEIEMPGHSYAALQAIPELRDPADTGIHRNILNPAVRQVYEFVETVVDEVARLFPSPWIHVGADEVPADAWLGSPLARELMREHGWQENYQLQSHFLRRVQAMIRELGRRTGAWQEAAFGGGIEAHDCYLVAWLGSGSGIALAEQGYDVVLAPGEAYYLDMVQSADWWEPGMDWAGTVSPERCYGYDPGGDWPDDLKPRLLGVQACLWGEHLHDRRLRDHLTVPRLSAIAEAAWTPSVAKDFCRFKALHGLMPKLGMGSPA